MEPVGITKEPAPDGHNLRKIKVVKPHESIIDSQKPGVKTAADVYDYTVRELSEEILHVLIISSCPHRNMGHEIGSDPPGAEVPGQGIMGAGKHPVECSCYLY